MPEPSLKEVQQWMKGRILPAPAASVGPAVQLNPQRGTPGEARMSVYAGGYVARMREALAEVYEAVHHILGDYTFTEEAHHYAAAYPSHEYNLAHAGRRFPEFLAAEPLAKQLPFLPDLARFEWLVCQIFHAAEQPRLTAQRVAALSLDQWAAARLVLQPGVALMASRWPVRDLWSARTQLRETINVELINRPQRAVLFRAGWAVRCELLTPAAYRLLERISAGEPLGGACEAAASEDVLPLRDWFAEWMAWGLFSDVIAPA